MNNNKVKIYFASTPPGPLWQKIFCLIYLISMKISTFMYRGPISNDKEYDNLAPMPGTPLAISFLIF